MREKVIALGEQRKILEKSLPLEPYWKALVQELSAETPVYQEDSLALYIVSPSADSTLIRAIGYEREIAFRLFGGGTGNSYDIDVWDSAGYDQIICIDHQVERIVGGYRFARGSQLVQLPAGERGAVEHLFNLSPNFVQEKLPCSLELGRSFIDASSLKSGRIMDILWYGLGYLITTEPWKYFMGKVTFYPKELKDGVLDILHTFLMVNFPASAKDFSGPRACFEYSPKPLPKEIVEAISANQGEPKTFEQCRKNLFRIFSRMGQHLRPFMLLFKYLSVGGSSVEFYGSAENPDFGHVVEIFFTLPVNSENRVKMDRYIDPIRNC